MKKIELARYLSAEKAVEITHNADETVSLFFTHTTTADIPVLGVKRGELLQSFPVCLTYEQMAEIYLVATIPDEEESKNV